MKITVKNFGPIGEAEDIEISPMTLFVGHSNTGKSYLAVLIYSIFNALPNNFWSPPFRQSLQGDATRLVEKHYSADIERLRDALSKENPDSTEIQKIAEELTESAFLYGRASLKKH